MINKTGFGEILFIALLSVLIPTVSQSQELRIDHIILLSSDLPDSIAHYEEQGFSIKKGRLHENGLINAHIKFKNSSSIELMSIAGVPNDDVSRTYGSLLDQNIKAAYVALTGLPIDSIVPELEALNIEYQVSVGKLWSYVSFQEDSELAHIFFIIYHQDLPSSEEYTSHANGFHHINSVKIEAGQRLIALLKNLELPYESKDLQGVAFATNTGRIIIEEVRDQSQRPKIKEVILARKDSSDTMSIALD